MRPLPLPLLRRWFVTKNKPHAKLGLCILGICWLAGCASPPPVQPEANSRPVEHPTPVQRVAQSTNQPVKTDAYSEPTEREAREIHEDECVFFPLGASTVSNKEKHKIDALAQRLLDDKNLVVTLIGHANDNGGSSFNLAVSDGRVMAVAEQLRKHGVQRSQIRKEALGSERTPKSCRSAECRQRSRRVEFAFSKQR
jgi:outer membrane protein OmpA-like peptidoglycan-associated protein